MDLALELVIKIFFAMALGFILYKIKMLNTEVNVALSRLLVEVVVVCMVFASIVSLDDEADKSDVIKLLIIGVIIYAVLIPVSIGLTRLLRTPAKSRGVYDSLMIFGNVGFIGLPIAESLYGDVGLFFMAILNIHFNLLCYTFGFWLITKDSEGDHKISLKSLLSPGIIAILVALIIFFLNIRVPDIIISPFKFVGNMTSPLALVVLGSSIAAHPIREVLSQWRIYILTFVRMIVFPIAAFFISKAILGPGIMTNIITLYIGMPSAVITGMFALAYGGDEESATAGTAMMNIFCVITIPGIYLLTTYG